MSSLVPEQRADKNGKIVTRHVRPISNSGSKASIPAPSAHPVVKPVHPNELENAYQLIRLKAGMRGGSMESIEKTMVSVSIADPGYFREIMSEVGEGSRYRANLWTTLLRQGLTGDGVVKELKKDAEVIFMLADLMEGRSEDQAAGPADLWNSSKGYYRIIPSQHENVFKASALTLWAKGYNLSLTELEPDIIYLAENLDRILPHAQVLRDRATIDRNFISALIDHAPAISEGAL